MRVVADYSFVRYPGATIRAAGFDGVLDYTGPARLTVDELRDVLDSGLSHGFIQETYSTRATEGYGAGVEDARYAEARANELLDALGLPHTDQILYVVSDGTSDSPGTQADLDGISGYAAGVGDASERPAFRVYGNVGCVDAARRGSAKCVGTMVPEPWGARPGLDDVWQMANIVSPLDGLDVDHAFVDFWGQIPNDGTTSERPKESSMWVAINRHGAGVRGMFVGGDCYQWMAVGAPGAYGIPQDVIDFQARGGEVHNVDDAKWQELLDRAQSYAALPTLLGYLPKAVVAALPPSSGGTAPASLTIRGTVEATATPT